MTDDRLAGGGWLALPAAHRVLYVLAGEATLTHGATAASVGPDTAWHGGGPCSITTHGTGAHVLRWELLQAPEAPRDWPGVNSRVVLEHPIAVDPARQYLLRCDRVEFDAGGEARPHRHRGGGIRYLVAGALEVWIGDDPPRTVTPGEAWFESGREPVRAVAATGEPTAFVRVALLPREIRGQSSIVYVDPADAAVAPRRYRVFVDEPVDLG